MIMKPLKMTAIFLGVIPLIIINMKWFFSAQYCFGVLDFLHLDVIFLNAVLIMTFACFLKKYFLYSWALRLIFISNFILAK